MILMNIRFIGASLNIILNMILISKYGIIGAAIATLVSFILMALFSYSINYKLLPGVNYNTSNIIKFMSHLTN